MIPERTPGDHDPADDPQRPDHCQLLDEYWQALRCEAATELRQQLIDQNGHGHSIALELDVLSKLHQAQREASSDGESAQLAAGLADSFATKTISSPGGNGGAIAVPGPAGAAPAEHPQRIGKYVVVELLDSGGQADVFRVIHAGLKKDCVLKLARRPPAIGNQAGRDPLQCEGPRLAQCEHPNLVRVIDQDVHEGCPFVVMEYVKGQTFQQYVALRRPGPRTAARLMIELAGAVDYLHEQGITHQDIKPQNVLIDADGRPRLIDLGLARQTHAWCKDDDDWIGGTAGYMSPEQANGLVHLIGPRTDVFGLGGLLYYLLTQRAVYVGSSPASVRRQAREGKIQPVRELNSDVSRSLARICMTALARDPDQRYPSAVELRRDLKLSLARRWIAGASCSALSLTAAAMFMLRSGSRPRTVQLNVARFDGEHYERQAGKQKTIGRIGRTNRSVRVGQGVSVTGKLNAPAYCYVIALTPDGNDQLYSRKESDLPELSVKIGDADMGFPLTEGVGLQVIVVLASREPLPAYKAWKHRDGLRQLWAAVAGDEAQDAVWEFADGEFNPISSESRGDPEKRTNLEPAPFKKICEYAAKLPGIDAIRAIAFPIKPMKPPEEGLQDESKD